MVSHRLLASHEALIPDFSEFADPWAKASLKEYHQLFWDVAMWVRAFQARYEWVDEPSDALISLLGGPTSKSRSASLAGTFIRERLRKEEVWFNGRDGHGIRNLYDGINTCLKTTVGFALFSEKVDTGRIYSLAMNVGGLHGEMAGYLLGSHCDRTGMLHEPWAGRSLLGEIAPGPIGREVGAQLGVYCNAVLDSKTLPIHGHHEGPLPDEASKHMKKVIDAHAQALVSGLAVSAIISMEWMTFLSFLEERLQRRD
jgi:hypothetical protein